MDLRALKKIALFMRTRLAICRVTAWLVCVSRRLLRPLDYIRLRAELFNSLACYLGGHNINNKRLQRVHSAAERMMDPERCSRYLCAAFPDANPLCKCWSLLSPGGSANTHTQLRLIRRPPDLCLNFYAASTAKSKDLKRD
jgi:hypothetical protein